jgi:hypothetical protein
MTRIATTTLTAALLLSGVCCDCASPPPQNAGPAVPVIAKIEVPTTGVRTIALPAMEIELPPGSGRLTVMATCTACHSQRYVMMQPNFPRKTWIAEVDKMKKVYGAPIQDEQVEPIVNYLVSIRGNGK